MIKFLILYPFYNMVCKNLLRFHRKKFWQHFLEKKKGVFNCWNIYDGAIKITKAWKIGYKVFNRKIYQLLATIAYVCTGKPAHEANVEAIEDVVDKSCLAALHQGYTRKRRKIRPSKPQMSFCTKNSHFIVLYL